MKAGNSGISQRQPCEQRHEVLAVAMKHLDDLDPEQPVIDPGEIESSLVLIGLVAMIDPQGLKLRRLCICASRLG